MTEMTEMTGATGTAAGRRPLHARARTLWTVTAGGGVLLAAIGATIGLAVAGEAWWGPLVAAPLAVALAMGYARLHWRCWWWGTSADALEVGHGVVRRRASYVPYHRIQQIDVERDLFERMVGLARLTVHTASATTDASIPGLSLDEARTLRRHLLARAGHDDGV